MICPKWFWSRTGSNWLAFIALTGLFITAVHRSAANDIHVGKNQSFQSIKKALESAGKGDHIFIHRGIYMEGQIIVDKQLVITGIDNPVLDGRNDTEILTIEADSVTVEGLVIRNVGTSFIKDRAGIKVESQHHVTIQNNRLENTFFGIFLVRSGDCLIKDNVVVGEAKDEFTAGNGIHLWYCKRIVVDHNTVMQHRDGIYLEFIEHCVIQNNTSKNNIRYGMHFMFSNNNDYAGNRFFQNGAGVAVMYSKNISMTGNTFQDNWGAASYGLLLKEIADSHLENNTFTRNTTGIHAENTLRTTITHNTFIRNGRAMNIFGNCEDNMINVNNFFSNTFDVVTNSQYNYNEILNNYWSSYTGYDLNHDGIGDIPYHPISLFSYVVEHNPPAIILMHSVFIELLNLAEKVVPVITPETISDETPLMKPARW